MLKQWYSLDKIDQSKMKLSKGMFRKVSLNENNNNVSNDKEYCYSLERIVELLLGKTSDEEERRQKKKDEVFKLYSPNRLSVSHVYASTSAA